MTNTDCRDHDFRLETERLVLRPWREDDTDALAAMNADPQVMRHFPGCLTPEQSRALFDRLCDKIATEGISFMPVEEKASGAFIGFVGLNRPAFPEPVFFEPCVEIGWRLVPSAWGKGYASEAAREWLRFGFETLRLNEIVAFTAAENERSQTVMRRLGMQPAGRFDHPGVPPARPDLFEHVLYSLARTDWCTVQNTRQSDRGAM
ncbi:GNAT family N-acetyltransferase [Breoghania sp. JC706]|uniref:GNAT family N-acetyltransferase n=1 Tax=Breoghania sp. JC706 TaxID=3117732 RepID=UPI0030099E71